MTCFGGRSKKIYVVEVLVHKLTLTQSKISDIGEYPIGVKIKFLDFPVFEVTREDFYSLKPPPPEEDGSLQFMVGRSCMFIKQPKELVRELESTSVTVGVFRVGDTYPTAETVISLPGCLCDQVAMAQNDPENLPKPFKVHGSYNLIDPGGNPSGTIELEIRMICMGRSIFTHYELHSSFFAFKNDNKEREFCVRRLVPPSCRTDGKDTDVTQYPDKTTLDELKGIKKDSEAKGKGKKKGKNEKGKKKGKK